ncbi:hypothetical protein [Sphaerisporangium sp. NPDC051011]|uniref:hypothetical protein n=1 Tax=Sphaerisporangium sp. NPDC051011 TaxID=3155792 RepID=UPI0033DCD993
MKSIRLTLNGAGQSQICALPLPSPVFGPTATGSEDVGVPVGTSALAVRVARFGEGADEMGPRSRSMRFVLAGKVRVAASNGVASLEPGDVVFVDDLEAAGHRVSSEDGAILLEVDLDAQWSPSGMVPAPTDGGRGASAEPTFRRMYVEDELAHFASFDDLLDSGSTAQPVSGLTFTCLSPDLASDWHTEEGISLVVVLSGGFELEVPGRGGAQIFRAGDVCLVDDRTGKGHITRTHGETRFAAIALPEGHRWSR